MLERAKEAFIDGEFFHEFIPIPDDLIDGPLNEIDATDNQENYGYRNSYDFCINEWGVSFDVSGDYIEEVGVIEFRFDSDLPPLKAYQRLVDQGFGVDAMYYCRDDMYCGEYNSGDKLQYEIIADRTWIESHIPDYISHVFPIVEDMVDNEEDW